VVRTVDPAIRIRDLRFTWPGSAMPCLTLPAGTLATGLLASLPPAWRASRMSLADAIG
jgi:hypothetical protein